MNNIFFSFFFFSFSYKFMYIYWCASLHPLKMKRRETQHTGWKSRKKKLYSVYSVHTKYLVGKLFNRIQVINIYRTFTEFLCFIFLGVLFWVWSRDGRRMELLWTMQLKDIKLFGKFPLIWNFYFAFCCRIFFTKKKSLLLL